MTGTHGVHVVHEVFITHPHFDAAGIRLPTDREYDGISLLPLKIKAFGV